MCEFSCKESLNCHLNKRFFLEPLILNKIIALSFLVKLDYTVKLQVIYHIDYKKIVDKKNNRE